MDKRLDEMTDEELGKAEQAALSAASEASRGVTAAINRIHDIRFEQFAREVRKPKRNRKK